MGNVRENNEARVTITAAEPAMLGPIPQNPTFDIPGITKLVNQELADPDCAKFAEIILNQPSKGKGGSLTDVFKAFLNQLKPHDLFTRTAPPGSRGEATAIGNLKNSTAAIFTRRDPNQTVHDADGTIRLNDNLRLRAFTSV